MYIYDIPPSFLSLNSNLELHETAIVLSFRTAVDTLPGPKIVQFYFRVLVPRFPDLRWHVRTQLVSRSLTSFPFFGPSLKILSIIILPSFDTTICFLELFRGPVLSECCESWLKYDTSRCYFGHPTSFFFEIFSAHRRSFLA